MSERFQNMRYSCTVLIVCTRTVYMFVLSVCLSWFHFDCVYRELQFRKASMIFDCSYSSTAHSHAMLSTTIFGLPDSTRSTNLPVFFVRSPRKDLRRLCTVRWGGWRWWLRINTTEFNCFVFLVGFVQINKHFSAADAVFAHIVELNLLNKLSRARSSLRS